MDDSSEKRKGKAQQLESLLVEGLDSGEPIDVDSEFWGNTKADLVARLAREQLETQQAIQSGFEDIETGRVKSAEQVHERLRNSIP